MLLTRHNLASHLTARGLLPRHTALNEPIEIVELFGRNRNFAVKIGGSTGLFVRQSSTMGGAGSAVEAELLGRLAAVPELAGLIPIFVDFDPVLSILAEELVDGDNLWDQCIDLIAPSLEVSREAGRTLALCHRHIGSLGAMGDERWAEQLPRPIPGVLAGRAGLPAKPSAAQRALSRIALSDENLKRGLDELREGYRFNAVIHGDVKWANCLVPAGKATVVLIDWETVCVGDAAWDLAGLLQSYLQRWALWSERRDEGMKGLVQLRCSAREALAGYLDAFALSGPAKTDLTRRAVRMAGARLVQSCSEMNREHERPDVTSLKLLQLASNVLAEPMEALHGLIGFRGLHQ